MKMHDKLGFEEPSLIYGGFYPANLRLARERGRELKKLHGLRSASSIKKAGGGRLAILIDYEDDFGDMGRLPVKGTFADVERASKRLIRGLLEDEYTDLIITLDCHPVQTVHDDGVWEDEHGNPPDTTLPVMMQLRPEADWKHLPADKQYPFEGIHISGAPNKLYRPRVMRKHLVEAYAPHLLATGQGPIWVFNSHCRAGTEGCALIPAIAEVVETICTARDIDPIYMWKGHLPQTDWFGPFEPCMPMPNHPQGGLQTQYLDKIREARATDVFGEAEDFCVKNGMKQVLKYYAGQPDVLRKIHFIGDCTSPIVADDVSKGITGNGEFRREMSDKGVKIISHDAAF